MRKSLRATEKLFFSSILSARLRFILKFIFVTRPDKKAKKAQRTQNGGACRAGQILHFARSLGDESHNRRDLPARAAERILKHLQMGLAPEQFIITGDTTNDSTAHNTSYACGRSR